MIPRRARSRRIDGRGGGVHARPDRGQARSARGRARVALVPLNRTRARACHRGDHRVQRSGRSRGGLHVHRHRGMYGSPPGLVCRATVGTTLLVVTVAPTGGPILHHRERATRAQGARRGASRTGTNRASRARSASGPHEVSARRTNTRGAPRHGCAETRDDAGRRTRRAPRRGHESVRCARASCARPMSDAAREPSTGLPIHARGRGRRDVAGALVSPPDHAGVAGRMGAGERARRARAAPRACRRAEARGAGSRGTRAAVKGRAAMSEVEASAPPIGAR